MSADLDEKRDAFESWCCLRWAGDRGALERRADGEYVAGNVEFAWQAFLQRPAGPSDPLRGIGFEWCAPGDMQHDRWILVFDDADRPRAVYEDEEAARAAFLRAEALGWNCYLFRLARRKP